MAKTAAVDFRQDVEKTAGNGNARIDGLIIGSGEEFATVLTAEAIRMRA